MKRRGATRGSLGLLGIGIGIGLAVAVMLGVVIARQRPRAHAATARRDAVVFHQLLTRGDVRVDLYLPALAALPAPGEKPSPWMVFAHERGWPAPDEKERTGVAIADAMQRRGIAVAVVSFDVTEARPLEREEEDVAEVVRELARRAAEYGLAAEPVLAGEQVGAAVVTRLALDARFGLEPAKLRGVIAMNGIYDPLPPARADAPPFLVLSARGDSPAAAQSSRALVRALEHAGATRVHGYHASTREERTLTNLSGEKNDVADLVAAFARGDAAPGGPETAWALSAAWGPRAPLTSEPFWKDERLVVRRPTDVRFRAAIRKLFGEMARDLEAWPVATYDAIDLADYLRAHPELGTGDWLVVTNARGEATVLSRSEIDSKKPVIVVGIDDERNLFRMFVTYNVHRAYSWKPDADARPLLVRHVGAFLYVPAPPAPSAPGAPGNTAGGGGGGDGTGLHVATLAEFALTTASFHRVDPDPLAAARRMPKPLAAALTDEQGCLQCHTLHGEGGRAHHLRASDGQVPEAHGLALEEYPRDVLRRFLFEQDAVAKSFGVGPLHVSEAVANLLLAEVTR